jgi:hypothetical protein
MSRNVSLVELAKRTVSVARHVLHSLFGLIRARARR